MKNEIRTLTDAFRKEWVLYLDDVPRSGNVYKFVKAADGDFRPAPKSGQIRLLADVERPLLVYLQQTKASSFLWDVIPLSPFHFPATSGEALVGKRVYQFWNRQDVSSIHIDRSFLVEEVPADERREIVAMAAHVENGADVADCLKPAIGEVVRRNDDTRLRYLHDFAVEPETFRSAERGRAFVRLTRKALWLAFAEHEFAAAAAGVENDYTAAVVAKRFPKNAKDFKRQYVECELKSQFLSLLPGERGERPLVYTWEGETPDGWRDSAVAAYVAKTGELFATGFLDIGLKRIVINDFSVSGGVSVPLEMASDLRLVIVPQEK